MATALVIVDRDWSVVYANASAHRLLERTKIEGRSLWSVYQPEAEGDRKLRRAMERQTTTAFHGYNKELNRWLHVQAQPWDQSGLTLFLDDVTAHTRMEQELQQHALRDQRIEILARLSAELAHEIKNPLAIIHARASDLADLCEGHETISCEPVAGACESIVRTSDRALRILRGLAALAREGRSDPMQPADPARIVEETLDLLAARCRTHSVRLERAIEPALPQIVCREVQIGQVVMNLLNNAIDAVSSLPEHDRWVRVELSAQAATAASGAQLLLDVIDNGPGIPEHDRARLMQSFFTTKPVGSGMGIGLSVSRSIAVDHGGSLTLIDPDRYTRFRLTIPLERPKETLT